MTVTTNTLSTGVTRTLIDQSAKLSAALNNREAKAAGSTQSAPQVAVADSAPDVTDAVALRVGAVNVALSNTKLDVLDSGATQVLRILGQLQSLASRATLAGLPESELAVINGQFQALRLSINNVPPAPPGSEYTATSVLGSLAADLPAELTSAVVGGFKDTNFLGEGEVTNLRTPDAAQQALQTVGEAIARVVTQRDTIESLKAVSGFAAASVESALQNQEALSATFDGIEETPSLVNLLQQQGAQAVQVQTSRLPANILQLLQQ